MNDMQSEAQTNTRGSLAVNARESSRRFRSSLITLTNFNFNFISGYWVLKTHTTDIIVAVKLPNSNLFNHLVKQAKKSTSLKIRR